MRSNFVGAATAVLVLSGFLGCGGSATGGSGPVAESDFPQRFAQATCGSMIDCCKTHGFAFDQATCESAASASVQKAIDDRASDKTRYDAAAAGRCLDAYQAVLQGCGSSTQDTDKACSGVFVGTLPQGAPCVHSDECIAAPNGNSFCDNGVCAQDNASPTARSKLNDPCSSTCTEGVSSTSCSGAISSGGGGASGGGSCYTNDGLACGKTGVCVPVPKLGESCAGIDNCASGAFCDGQNCVAQTASGPCSFSNACTASSYCSVGQCTPRKANGAACVSDEECVVDRCTNSVCSPKIPVSASTCAGNIG